MDNIICFLLVILIISDNTSECEKDLNIAAFWFNGLLSMQDLGMDYFVIGESFETSVPWDR